MKLDVSDSPAMAPATTARERNDARRIARRDGQRHEHHLRLIATLDERMAAEDERVSRREAARAKLVATLRTAAARMAMEPWTPPMIIRVPSRPGGSR